jgi:beta-lactamase regulating signal transducer with metallopeptidase domain
MILLSQWLSPEFLQPLGLALLHFLWQGAALAAVAALAMSLAKKASTRYALGVVVMVAMVAAPVATIMILRQPLPSLDAPAATQSNTQLISAARTAHKSQFQQKVGNESEPLPATPYAWLVQAWFLGVLLFSMRTAGGVLLLERLRRREAIEVCEELLHRCLKVQRRMGLHRIVRYCESVQLDAPAVIGWLRPVVLLPFSAVSGLSAMQLEAVIAHELAHVRRYDAFVNLFQVAMESVLFYHPAVWWLSKRVRLEREHCCDDVAIAICGSRYEYALALTMMEEWRATPSLALAVNQGSLTLRVRRLLGTPVLNSGVRTAEIVACLLCLSVASVAANAMFGISHGSATTQTTENAKSRREKDIAAAFVVRSDEAQDEKHHAKAASATTPSAPAASASPAPATARSAPAATFIPAAASAPAPAPSPAPAPVVAYTGVLPQRISVAIPVVVASPVTTTVSLPALAIRVQATTKTTTATATQAASQSVKAESFIDSMKAAGLGDLTVDDLIALKTQGVTPEYVRSMRAEGFKVDTDEVVGMKVQGITPEYVHELRQEGLNPDANEIIGLKVQGITPEYIKQMKELGMKVDADELIGMKVQGVTPEYVREMRAAGIKTDADDLIGMKVQGITPAYVKEIEALGLHADADALIGMKVQGVTPDDVKALQAAGLKFDVDDLISAKVQGITPEFIESVRSHGFKNLTLDKLIELKESGVLE